MKRITTNLPIRWKADFLHAQANIAPSKYSDLRLKLLVFKSHAGFVVGWNRLFQHNHIDKSTGGVVHELSREIIRFNRNQEEHIFEHDLRYFAVMGLVKGRINMEVVTHESIHAAACLLRRKGRRLILDQPEEEELCYPAGYIARQINLFLHRNCLY